MQWFLECGEVHWEHDFVVFIDDACGCYFFSIFCVVDFVGGSFWDVVVCKIYFDVIALFVEKGNGVRIGDLGVCCDAQNILQIEFFDVFPLTVLV